MIALGVVAVAYVAAVCVAHVRNRRRFDGFGVVRSKPRPYDWTEL